MLYLQVSKGIQEKALSLVNYDTVIRFRKVEVRPWAFSDRFVCRDSYFSNIEAAENIHGMGL